MMNAGAVLNNTINETYETYDEYIDRLAAQMDDGIVMIPFHHATDWKGDRFEDECPCYWCGYSDCNTCDVNPFAS